MMTTSFAAERQACERCGRGIPPWRRDTGFCSRKCARDQRAEDALSAAAKDAAVAEAELQALGAFVRGVQAIQAEAEWRWTPEERERLAERERLEDLEASNRRAWWWNGMAGWFASGAVMLREWT